MRKTVILVYGVAVYALFSVAFLYLIGFTTGLVVPKSVDSGKAGPLWAAVVVDLAFIALFGIQHTIMARPAFKQWWTTIVPRAAERSTFVLLAAVILIAMMYFWRPIEGVVWDMQSPALRFALYAISLAGYGIVLYSSFLIDHFDLFGLRQVWLLFRGVDFTPPHFAERSLYRWVRHPLMLGFLLAFWATPTMTYGHLLFAAGFAVYTVFGVWIEERDLIALHGDRYLSYRRRTPGIIPWRLANRG